MVTKKTAACKPMAKCKPKIDKADAREVKKNMRDIKAGMRRADMDTEARSENYVKELRNKKGALHEELGAPRNLRNK